MTRASDTHDNAGERLELEPELLELDAALSALGAAERAAADEAAIARIGDAGAEVLRGESSLIVTAGGTDASVSFLHGRGWIAAAAGIAVVAAAGLTLIGVRGGPGGGAQGDSVTVAVGYAEYDLVDEFLSDDSFWSASFSEDEASIAAGAAAVEAGLGSPLDGATEWDGDWGSAGDETLGWFGEEAG